MSVKIDIIPFCPTLECRYFVDLELLKFWKYNFDKVDLLGLSGGFCFAYTTVSIDKNHFFSIFGRRPKLLQKICLFLNGEYFEDYDATIYDLHYLTEHMEIPVVVKVDFNKFKNYYSMAIRSLISIRIEKISKFNIINSFPHDIIVIGCDNKVVCFDNLTKTKLSIPVDEFISMWEIPCFEYGGVRKRYLEYVFIPYVSNFEKYSFLLYSLQLVINSFISTYSNNDTNDYKAAKFLLGEQGFAQFKKDLQEDKFNMKEFTFSIEMIYELDKNFWKGLERRDFGNFLERVCECSKCLNYRKSQLKNLRNFYYYLSQQWMGFFSLARKLEKEKILQTLDEIIKFEKEAVYLLSEIIIQNGI